MIIRRDYYLNRLIAVKHSNMIKIVTGLRRCGKSFLLFQLFHFHLLEAGVSPEHIIEISLDDFRNADLRNPHNLLDYVDSRIGDAGQYYLILDEVQLLDRFVDVLNSFMHMPNVDVYVTGSNSRFLSSDVATEFRGRGVEIHLFPLSFAELYAAKGGDKSALWKDYYRYGGLPYVWESDSAESRMDYLHSLCDTVYTRDIIERNGLKNSEEFTELMRVMASTIGSPCNPSKISKTFKSVKNVALSDKTIARYLSYLQDAFLIEEAMRYDVKGRKYIGTLSKYYFQDLGLRNALLDFRQNEENHIMENVVYNELRLRGYRVDVGTVSVRTSSMVKQLEIDFVANKGDVRYYIQSAFDIPDDDKREQESASLKHIDDSFRKIIIVRNDIAPYNDRNGFLNIGLMDFLLGMEWA